MSDYREKLERDFKKFIDEFGKLPNKYESRYTIYRRYGICIDIFAEYTSMSNYNDKDSCTEICPGLWAVYATYLSGTALDHFGLSKNEQFFCGRD